MIKIFLIIITSLICYYFSINVKDLNDESNTYVAIKDNSEGDINEEPRRCAFWSDPTRFIAHAGGEIDGVKYTNSLEALNLNYAKGFRYFELDFIRSSDNKYVAAHDWKHWTSVVNYEGELPVSESVFKKFLIYEKYTSLTMDKVNRWFKAHNDCILVTDKVNEPKEFAKCFVDRDRLIMELFTWGAVEEGIEIGLKSAMPSENLLKPFNRYLLIKLKYLGVSNIAVSQRSIEKNKELLSLFNKFGIKTYVFHVNHDTCINEDYVYRYEFGTVHGMYADSWILDSTFIKNP